VSVLGRAARNHAFKEFVLTIIFNLNLNAKP
jgi:hypothetical protein